MKVEGGGAEGHAISESLRDQLHVPLCTSRQVNDPHSCEWCPWSRVRKVLSVMAPLITTEVVSLGAEGKDKFICAPSTLDKCHS